MTRSFFDHRVCSSGRPRGRPPSSSSMPSNREAGILNKALLNANSEKIEKTLFTIEYIVSLNLLGNEFFEVALRGRRARTALRPFLDIEVVRLACLEVVF